MKKAYYLIIVLVIIITSCKEEKIYTDLIAQPDRSLSQYGTRILLNKSIDSILVEFVTQNNLKNIQGQLYVNKINEDSIIIFIISRQFIHHELPYFSHKRTYPLFYVKVKDCIFDVYTGFENLFESNYNYPKDSIDTSTFIVWQFCQSLEKISRINGERDLPYVPKFDGKSVIPPPPPK